MNNIVYIGKHSITFRVPRHEHDSWEIIYCTAENGTVHFDDCEIAYKAGDVIVVPPMTPHSNASDIGFSDIHLNLADTVLNFTKPILLHDDSNCSILSVFSGAYYQYYENSVQRETLLSAYGSLIVAYIFSYRDVISLSRIVQDIENDIVRHYSDPNYTLEEYLHSLPYNYDYLRKLFQKELGMTPHKYLNDKRLQTAANMLCSEYNGGNVTEVAHLCGFREALYFSRMFRKKYGVSPSNYYARMRAKLSGLTITPEPIEP